MNLQDLISETTTTVFLNEEDGFAQRIIHYPRGDLSRGKEWLAIIEMETDGSTVGKSTTKGRVRDSTGTRVEEAIWIELSSECEVVLAERPQHADIFKVAGRYYYALKFGDRDSFTNGMQRIGLLRTELVNSSRPNRVPPAS